MRSQVLGQNWDDFRYRPLCSAWGMKPMFWGWIVWIPRSIPCRFLLEDWSPYLRPSHSVKRVFCKNEESGFGQKFFVRRLGCFPLRSACSALRYADGLATIQTLQNVLPDDRMRHIFSTSFRKDFIQQVVSDHCIHRHNVVLCMKLWQIIADFLSGFCTRSFTASSLHLSRLCL